MNYVYLLRCADDTYYCGWTTSLASRLAAHNAGTGAKYTRSRRPVELVYFEEYEDRHEALSREWHIKRMSREEKINLMERGRKMLETGIKGTLETTVTKDKTARHAGSGELEGTHERFIIDNEKFMAKAASRGR